MLSLRAQSQENFITVSVVNDSIKQTQLYSKDSTLLRSTVFRYDVDKGKYLVFQEVTYYSNGVIKRVFTQPKRKISEHGDIFYEEASMDINQSGRAEQIVITNKFKLFRRFKFDSEKQKYNRKR